jgi:N-acyl-L-homoserine lactone synthetase
MECKMASNEMEQSAILRQRYDVFVEEFNFFAPREDGKRIEYDAYDEHALLFGVWEKDMLIASCRLILPINPLGLPTLNTMVIDSEKLQDIQQTAEISRITVASDQRAFRKTIKVLQTMQKEINRISANYEIIQWIGAVGPRFLRLLNQSRLLYRPIGPLQFHIGSERYPVLLRLQDYTA